jgi:hypothetical protein
MTWLTPNKRPRCAKCSGFLLPEITLDGAVIAVKCFACGARVDRYYKRREADAQEGNIRTLPKKKKYLGPSRSRYQDGLHRGIER